VTWLLNAWPGWLSVMVCAKAGGVGAAAVRLAVWEGEAASLAAANATATAARAVSRKRCLIGEGSFLPLATCRFVLRTVTT